DPRHGLAERRVSQLFQGPRRRRRVRTLAQPSLIEESTMNHHRSSRGLVGFAARHRAATAFLLLFLMASPARPDDRQLLQANSGATTNVLLILDTSTSMNDDFSDVYRLPAFMDDFIYPEGTVPASGSKFAIAKSVLRQVLTNTAGVNWAFATYRNPYQTLG